MVVPCSPGNPSSLRVRAVVRNIQPSRVWKKWIKILHPDLFLRTRGTVETTSSCWANKAYLVVSSKRGGGTEAEVRGDGSTSLTEPRRLSAVAQCTRPSRAGLAAHEPPATGCRSRTSLRPGARRARPSRACPTASGAPRRSHGTRLLEPRPPSPPQHVAGGATRARRALDLDWIERKP